MPLPSKDRPYSSRKCETYSSRKCETYGTAKSKFGRRTWENACWWWSIPEKRLKSEINFKRNVDQGDDFIPNSLDLLYKPYRLTKFNKVKIVFVTHAPTRGTNGLGLSLLPNVPISSSLQRNIKAELEADLGIRMRNFDLTPWAKKGILLINKHPIRVYKGNYTWKKTYKFLTMWTIRNLSSYHEKLVFILVGEGAAKLKKYIDTTRHLVIVTSTSHDPLRKTRFHNRYRGFKGSKVFSRACKFLGISTNIWRLE